MTFRASIARDSVEQSYSTAKRRFRLKGMDGLKATKLIKKSCPTTEVIILTNNPLDDWKERARESPQMVQSSAFLSKQEIGKSLLPIINSLMAGKLGESDS
ncbi:MAG: hypothetical protein V3U08_07975 [Nitrospirales bacterium]